MILGISTGCFWQSGLPEIKILRFLRRLPELDAIELVFAFPEELFDFRPKREDIAFLHSKKHVSLHAPFNEVEYKNNAKSKRLLAALNSLALKCEAENVVFHAHTIKDFSLFEGIDFSPLAENLVSKKGTDRLVSVQQCKDFLSSHENFGFCFDLGDSLAEKIKPKDFFALKNRLKEAHIHFPAIEKGKLKPHCLPSKTGKKFLDEVKAVPFPNVPLILEGYFPSAEQGIAAKEIELFKTLMDCKSKI